MNDIPRNAQKLADDARANGWQATITTGRGALLNKRADAGFDVVESLAVRLRSPDDHVRAFGVWAKLEGPGTKWKFDNGQVRCRRTSSRDGSRQGVRGYRELRDLIAAGES